jgi:hypothetical protein
VIRSTGVSPVPNSALGSNLMVKALLALSCTALLAFASCKKEASVSDKSEGQAAAPSTFPTVDEKALAGVVRTRFDSPNPTEAQLSRRARNNKVIRELGLPILESLPVIEDDNLVALRTSQEVASRCLATEFCAVKGEAQDQKLVDSLIKDYSAASYFLSDEQRFIQNPTPPKQDLIDFCWRYECAHVFLWAINAKDRLSAPNVVCPVADDAKAIKNLGPVDFVPKAKLRSTGEIVDAADLYYRLHWAAIELRLKGIKSEKVDEEIVRERHRALNWLIRYMNQDWDHVTTDT